MHNAIVDCHILNPVEKSGKMQTVQRFTTQRFTTQRLSL